VFFRRGAFARWYSSILEMPWTPEAAMVLIGPAEIAFTRIPFGPRSAARYRTEHSRAALATPITL
jgi:hypothetical protein